MQQLPFNGENRLFLWTMNITLILESTVTTTKGTTIATWTTKRDGRGWGDHSRRVINCISSFCTGHISTWGFRTSIRARFAPMKSTTPYSPPSLYTDPLTGEHENPFKCISKCLLHLRSSCYKINSVRYGAIYNLICYSSPNLLGQLIFIRYAQSWFSEPIELGTWNANIIWFSEFYFITIFKQKSYSHSLDQLNFSWNFFLVAGLTIYYRMH